MDTWVQVTGHESGKRTWVNLAHAREWVQVTGHESGKRTWVNLAHVREMDRPVDAGPTRLWWFYPDDEADPHATVEETPGALLAQARGHQHPRVDVHVAGGIVHVNKPAGVDVYIHDHDGDGSFRGPVTHELRVADAGTAVQEWSEEKQTVPCITCCGTGQGNYDNAVTPCQDCKGTGLMPLAVLRHKHGEKQP